MIEYVDLNKEELTEMYDRAFKFLHEHSDHVRTLFGGRTPRIAPSGSDLFHPELWKGIHWAWFFTEFGIGED